jgi:hypothetical protein
VREHDLLLRRFARRDGLKEAVDEVGERISVVAGTLEVVEDVGHLVTAVRSRELVEQGRGRLVHVCPLRSFASARWWI